MERHSRKVAGWVAGVAVAGMVLAGAWVILKVHREAGQLWDRVSDEHEVRVVAGRVLPVGPRTWRVYDLAIWPENVDGVAASQPMLHVERLSLTFCPPVQGERRRVCSVIIREPQLFVELHEESGGHLEWIARRLEGRATAPPGDDASREGAQRDRPSSLPALRIEGGHLAIEDAGGRFPGLGAHVEHILLEEIDDGRRWHREGDGLPARIRMEGRVLLEGWGPGRLRLDRRGEVARLVFTPASDHNLLPSGHGLPGVGRRAQLSVGSVSVSWPFAVQVHSIRLEQGNTPPRLAGLGVGSLWVDEATLSFSPEAAELTSRAVRARVVDGDGATSLRARDLRLAWPWQGETVTGALLVGPEDEEGSLSLSWEVDREQAALTVHGHFEDFPVALLSPWIARIAATQVHAGRLDGEASMTWTRLGDQWTATASLQCTDAAMNLPEVAGGALTGVHVGLDMAWIGAGPFREIELAPSRVRLGMLPLTVEGAWSQGDTVRRTRGRVALALDEADEALASLPPQLLPVLRTVGARGPMDVRLSWFLDAHVPTEGLLELDGRFDSLEIGDPLWEARWAALGAEVPQWSWITEVGEERAFDSQRWVGLERLDPAVVRAFLAAEDDRFFLHAGVDVRGLRAAMQHNLEAGRWERGGSTISQQVAKNLLLDHRRTLDRKVEEWALTLLMEANLSKERILELYLNMARMGESVWGIGEASLFYFSRPASELTVEQAVQLAAILPGPALFGPALLAGDLPEDRRVKMGNILRNLHAAGVLDREQFAAARRSLGVIMVPPPAAPPHPTAASQRP